MQEVITVSFDPKVRNVALMSRIKPSLRMKDGEDLACWQKKARARLKELLGYPFETCDPDFRVEWTKTENGVTETRFLFCSEPDVDVICHLLVPEHKEEKLPLIICLQGHAKGMHISLGRPKYPGDEITISGGDRDFARQIIARGQAALAIEQRAFGDRGGTPEGPACAQPASQAMLIGKTLIGQRCHDISSAIDVTLANFPFLDGDRIAIMGNSGGGTASIYAAAVDERIAVCMPSCSFCGYKASIGEQVHCLCNYIPGIFKDFDMGDLAGLIAPRPFVPVSGTYDEGFPLFSAREQFDVAMSYYRAAGAEDKARHVIGPEGHRFYAALSWPVFDEITGWRK